MVSSDWDYLVFHMRVRTGSTGTKSDSATNRIQKLIGFRNKCLRIQKLVLSDSEANENGFRN